MAHLFYTKSLYLSKLKFKKKFYIGAYLIYNVVLVSGMCHSDSVIYTHISILFQILFPYSYYTVLSRVPCAIVGPRWLSVLYTAVCILIPAS